MYEWVHDGVNITALIVAVVVLKVELRWLKEWCKEHKADDERNFKRLDDDVRQMRGQDR